MRRIFSVGAGVLILSFCMDSFAASIIEVQNFKRHVISAEEDTVVKIIVRSETSLGSDGLSRISIQKIDDQLFLASIVPNSAVDGSIELGLDQLNSSIIVDGKANKVVSMLAPDELVVEVEGISYPPVERSVCMAYWVGYVFDREIGRCVQRGASGCRNPFKYKSMESCQLARLRR